ncbi:MAG: 16S rRNA (adenine(1518)-N(6)/adenine(1519)-N(6))-dimethyltransferase RsmA [Candidatus Omnitrophica bacterium]|nr:16S rRNA (adenine(1518)-N(6)/adenine(1519)-N(6))-dimethyltransferase RsmA [Candidatus Omnitrophota bacterium]
MYTKTQLLEIWGKHDFRAKKSFGQNFLVDKNLIDKLIRAIDIKKSDTVLEIGPGFGEMTEYLLKAKKVVVVEKDRFLAKFLTTELFKNIQNIKIIEQDFLDFDLNGSYDKIIGNLPYYITTPIIEKLLFETECKQIFLMVQKEYADRLLALVGTKTYSSLTCFVNYYAKVEKISIVCKECFFPAPKVDSMFIKIERLKKPQFKVNDEKMFFNIIRKSFQHRRKTISSCLKKFVFEDNNIEIEKVLNRLGIDPNVRPEELSIQDFASLADSFSGIQNLSNK